MDTNQTTNAIDESKKTETTESIITDKDWDRLMKVIARGVFNGAIGAGIIVLIINFLMGVIIGMLNH